MRVVVTGGAGFIGRAVVKRLANRGDDVSALVRDREKAQFLTAPRVTLIKSDLRSVPAMTAQMTGADGVIHGAGWYRIGISTAERPRMWDANVGATERVLDAAIAAKVPRIVYISTNNVFGDTHGEVVDETFRRDLAAGFVSYYDETKFRAHEAALKRITAGAPIVIVQPGQVYGPHDHSQASAQLEMAFSGRLRVRALANSGVAWVHVDDVADGIVSALERGRIGEAYSLGGDVRRMGEAIDAAARLGGKRAPRLTVPTSLLRFAARFSDRVAEIVSAADDVTYWASHDKATRELGFSPRGLEQGIADTWGSGGKLS